MTRAQMQEEAVRLGRATGASVALDEPLAGHLTMRVGGCVAALVSPRTTDQLREVVSGLNDAGVPLRLLGGGSNLLAADGPLDFVVVEMAAASSGSVWEGVTARVPAGASLASVLAESVRRGLRGLEWAAGLPGSVGGAVVGNAGAFGGEIARVVREVALLSEDGSVRRHAVRPGDFGYRSSFVREGEIVVEVSIELEPSEPDAVREAANRVNRARAGSQPKGGHSSGCIFKNPPGDAAGRLVDAAGLKGLRVGGARVSEAHGNFVINDGTATAADILELIRRVREGVRERHGVELELEVRIWAPEGEGA